MPRNKKFIISMLIIISAVACLLFLSSFSLLLSFLLIVLAILKHKFIPIKKEFLWYLFICIGGAIVEILLVNIGGAWEYATQHIFNIPIWMPLFWGVLGTSIIVLYEGFTEK